MIRDVAMFYLSSACVPNLNKPEILLSDKGLIEVLVNDVQRREPKQTQMSFRNTNLEFS